jgi:hypothetical protein
MRTACTMEPKSSSRYQRLLRAPSMPRPPITVDVGALSGHRSPRRGRGTISQFLSAFTILSFCSGTTRANVYVLMRCRSAASSIASSSRPV